MLCVCVSYDTLYIQEGTHSHTYCSLSPLLSPPPLPLPPSLPPSLSLPLSLSPSLSLPLPLPLPLSPSLRLVLLQPIPLLSGNLISRLGLAHAYKTLSEITNATCKMTAFRTAEALKAEATLYRQTEVYICMCMSRQSVVDW